MEFHNNNSIPSPNIQWSEEFQCFTVNGVLAVIPLSAVAPNPEELSTIEVESIERSKTEELFFRLFRFPNEGEKYLLEMHEFKVDGNIYYYQLLLQRNNEQSKVKIHGVEPDNRVILPMLEDSTSPMFPKKYKLSLHDRLVGWTIVKNRQNGKERKFYYHQGVQFRSFIEVATFILYSNKPKGLQTN